MADEVLEIIDDGRNDWIEPQGDQKTYKPNGEPGAAPSQSSIGAPLRHPLWGYRCDDR
jgi:hypothetical protein